MGNKGKWGINDNLGYTLFLKPLQQFFAFKPYNNFIDKGGLSTWISKANIS